MAHGAAKSKEAQDMMPEMNKHELVRQVRHFNTTKIIK